MSLPLTCPLLGTWPRALACALTGNRTETLWFAGLSVLNPLSYTSQGLKVWHFAFMILFNSFPCEVDMMVFIFLIRKKLRHCFPFFMRKTAFLFLMRKT